MNDFETPFEDNKYEGAFLTLQNEIQKRAYKLNSLTKNEYIRLLKLAYDEANINSLTSWNVNTPIRFLPHLYNETIFFIKNRVIPEASL